jgi:hypothetical protein
MTHKLTIDISVSERKRIKTAASVMGTTIKSLILMAFEEFMQKKFNKVTERTLKMSEQRKGLKKFNSLEELFDDLGI